MSGNVSITPDMISAVETLDRYVTQEKVATQFAKAAQAALAEISAGAEYAVIDLPVSAIDVQAPDYLGTIRIAAFRPSSVMEPERHANSTQFLYSLQGQGETRVLTGNVWRNDSYGGVSKGTLADRWHVVGQGVWHQSVAAGSAPWVVAALHTATDVQDESWPSATP